MKYPVFGALVIAASMAAPFSAQANFLQQLKDKVIEQTQGSGTGSTGIASVLSNDEVIAGLKEALRVGTERVVGQIGATDGFNADPAIHIPLPPSLQKVQSTLKKVGLSSLADDVELRLNRAAEEAAPKTKELVWKAINEMTLEDAQKIYDGPKDAATQYFRRVASGDLATVIKPVVDNALNDAGAVQAYDSLVGQYANIPFMPDIKGDLSQHAVDLTMQGLFHYLAQEEAAIRENPVKRTTEILQKVFGQ